MSFKEALITDWKYKTLEYQGKKMWIVEQFDYEGTNYLYAIDENTLEKDIFDVAFLYKIEDDIFGNVTDDKLFNELLGNVAGIMAREQIENIRKEYNL